jgi:hypothetical protein
MRSSCGGRDARNISWEMLAYMTNKYFMIALRWILVRLVAGWEDHVLWKALGIDEVIPVPN